MAIEEKRYVGHLFIEIEDMFDKKPDARKKEEFKEWKNKLNSLINECNKLGKFKYYSTIK